VSLYVEIHCDVRRQGRDPVRRDLPFCFTDSNANPQGWTPKDAKAAARKGGWTIAPHDMAACPNCANEALVPFFYPEDHQS